MAEVAPGDRPEQLAEVLLVVGEVGRSVAAVDDPAELGDPGHALVASVPDDSQHAAGPESPRELGKGPGRRRTSGTPAPRSTASNDLPGTGRRLRRPGQHLDARDGRLERVAHEGVGLDRRDVVARRDEGARQLPGSGADVQHARG